MLGILVLSSGGLSVAQYRLVPEGEPAESPLPPRVLLYDRLDWGVLVGIEENRSDEPLLYTIGKGGQYERIVFRIPDAGYINVYGVAAGPEGQLALSGSAYTAEGKATTFVAWIAPDRKRQTVVRTWPYVGSKLTLAADGTIWTVGWVLDEERDRTLQWNVLKRFDSSGKVLGTLAVRARAGPERGPNAVGYSEMRASRDRVGWLTNGMEYIEFSLDGREVNRFGPPSMSESWDLSLALSEDNRVMVGVVDHGKTEIWALARKQGAWAPFEVTGTEIPRQNRLLGFDGQTLVTRNEHHMLCRWRMATR